MKWSFIVVEDDLGILVVMKYALGKFIQGGLVEWNNVCFKFKEVLLEYCEGLEVLIVLCSKAKA